MTSQNGANIEFKTESQIESFLGSKAKSFEEWYKNTSKNDELTTIQQMTDDWFRWYYGSSKKLGEADDTNWKLSSNGVYFIRPEPFQRPYLKPITMERGQSLLIPVYSTSASKKEYPSCQNLSKVVEEDLQGIYEKDFEVKLDGDKHVGKCIIRDKPLKIAGDIHHGGFWILLSADRLGYGDHLLSFKANSKNYEVEVKIPIRVLI